MFERLNLHSRDLHKDTPVHAKTEKVPHVPDWQGHAWVWFHALPPLVLHQLYVFVTGHNLNPIPAYFLYFACFQVNGIHQIKQMCSLGHRYGFLDGDKHERDEVPDVAVGKVFTSLLLTSILRCLMSITLAYNVNKTPLQLSWLALPLEIGLYEIVLDFWFYWYHRVMHQFESLWKYHRTHHLTKHPNPLLTLYADEEQEFFDIAGIPILAFLTLRLMGFPMGFYEWWICQQYQVFTELAGHSGLRIDSTPPSTLSWLLRYFDCDLSIEDHDLHHRIGWKKSHNYGKQTRLWDRIFGTCHDRIELARENIDYENTATIFVGRFPWG